MIDPKTLAWLAFNALWVVAVLKSVRRSNRARR